MCTGAASAIKDDVHVKQSSGSFSLDPNSESLHTAFYILHPTLQTLQTLHFIGRWTYRVYETFVQRGGPDQPRALRRLRAVVVDAWIWEVRDLEIWV